jgi:hypothetical protein
MASSGAMMTTRSMTLRSSRMLPGHRYIFKRAIAPLVTDFAPYLK